MISQASREGLAVVMTSAVVVMVMVRALVVLKYETSTNSYSNSKNQMISNVALKIGSLALRIIGSDLIGDSDCR